MFFALEKSGFELETLFACKLLVAVESKKITFLGQL